MGYREEFPNYDDELWIPKGFIDNSWHNDACPHAEKVIIDVPKLYVSANVWQEYKDPSNRECEKRYMFTINVNNDNVFFYDTDDLEEIKKLIDANALNWL